MHIIVRGNNSRGTSKGSSSYQGFTPHWNNAIDKNPIWIGTRQQYDRELKSRGLRPATGYIQPIRKKKYSVTDKTRHIIQAIKDQSDGKGNFNPSGVLKEELIRRKVIRPMKEVKEMQENATRNEKAAKKGGFF